MTARYYSEVESSITFSSKGDHEGANFLYEVEPPFLDVENRALITTGLMLGATIDGSGIDPNGESVVEPVAMERYEDGEAVASLVKVAGAASPMKRLTNLERIAGALTVMRNGPVEITFDDEARQLAQVI